MATRGGACPHAWFMSKEQIANSPSLAFLTEKHGNAEKAREEETTKRRSTCGFLQDTGQKLRMPQLTIATAIVFYHRFFAHKSYEKFNPFVIATTCLFLASKVEETPKKLKDVIIESAKIEEPSKQPPDPESREFWEQKERILISERVLLQTLGFDLTVEHAYRPLLAYVKSIKGTRDLAQVAWNFINDSLRTTICLQYAPRCVSAAAVHLAAKYLSERQNRPFELPPHLGGKWFDAFQVSEEALKDISDQIMELYDKTPDHAGAGLSNGNAGALISQRQSPHGPTSTANGNSGGQAATPSSANAEANGPRVPPDAPANVQQEAAAAANAVAKRDADADDAATTTDARAKDECGIEVGAGRADTEPTAKRPREA